MSIEDLKADIERNTTDFDSVTFNSLDDVKQFMKTTMFPIMTNVVEEMEQIDDDVADIIQQASDVLQPETAGIFAAVITQCRGLAEGLKRRLKKGDKNDDKWAVRLPKILAICDAAQDTLLEITVTPTDEGDEPETVPAPTAPVNTNELEKGAADAT